MRRGCTPARCSERCSTASRGIQPRDMRSSEAAAEAGFREAVRERDEPFGDLGRSTFKG